MKPITSIIIMFVIYVSGWNHVGPSPEEITHNLWNGYVYAKNLTNETIAKYDASGNPDTRNP